MTSFAFGDQQNAPNTLGSFSFGTNSTTAPSLTGQPTLGTNTFGTAPLGGITQAAPAFSTGFATTAATGFPTAGQPAVSSTGGFSFGGFGNTATGSNLTLGTGTSLLPTTTTASSVGLGGVDVQTSTGSDSTNPSNKKDFKAAKESQIPNEISVTVESFKKYVKEQKAIREEMSRVSDKNILKVQELVATLRQQLSIVSNGLQRNAIAISKLKEESNRELKNAEIAQRTKDAPASLQYENNAPTEYFHNLANSFEKQMQSYRQQIEQLERHLLSISQPYTLTLNEWTSIHRRLHDTFVTLAAQLQTVHQEVQACMEHLMNTQRLNHGDVRNLYENFKDNVIDCALQKHLPASVTYGPSPFAVMQSAVGKAIKGFSRSQQLPGIAGSMSIQSFSTRLTVSSPYFKPLGK